MALDPETFDTLIDTIRRFVRERLRPLEAEVEAADAIPAEVIGEMKALGLFGLSIAEELWRPGADDARGMQGRDRARPHHAGLPLQLRHQCRHRLPGLVMAGTTEQKAEWLPRHRQRRDRHQLRPHRAGCRIGQRRSEDPGGPRRRRLSPQRHQALHHQCRQGASCSP